MRTKTRPTFKFSSSVEIKSTFVDSLPPSLRLGVACPHECLRPQKSADRLEKAVVGVLLGERGWGKPLSSRLHRRLSYWHNGPAMINNVGFCWLRVCHSFVWSFVPSLLWPARSRIVPRNETSAIPNKIVIHGIRLELWCSFASKAFQRPC
jgi:hypothetical protein